MTLRAKKKQLIAAALATLLAIGTAVPVVVSAPTALAAESQSEVADIWNGKYDFSWYKDEDKETYAIVNARQLAGLSALSNGLYKKTKSGYQYDKDGNEEKISFQGKTFRLARNLDLNGKEWMPIGASEDGSSGTFSGTFQGDDHIIYNLKITEGTDYQGLFGAVDSSGSLEGIHLRNASITADGHTGILAGKTAGDVKNCSSSGTITANGDQAGGLISQASGTITNSYSTASVKGNSVIGGLIGQADQGTELVDCYAKGTVMGESNQAGGLVGAAQGASVKNSYSTSMVKGQGSIGGLIGTMKNGNDITKSYFSGSVLGEDEIGGLVGSITDGSNEIVSSYSSGMVTGKNYVGGVVGSIPKSNTVEKSYSTGTIQGENYVGGVTGSSHAALENCSARGSVSGKEHVGGVVGKLEESSIEKCYVSAKVSGTEKVGGVVGATDDKSTIVSSYGSGAVSGKNFVGGLVGASWNTIEQSHARGNVTGTGEYVGGLAGYTEGDVKSCYASGNVSGADWVGGLIGVAYTKTVSDCAATGNVTLTNGEESSVGGVVGGLFGDMVNCYSGGTVTGKDLIHGAMGGVVGTIYGNMSTCIALNPSIQGGGNLLGRVAGEYGAHPKTKEVGEVLDSYAFQGMTVNGNIVKDDDTEPQDTLNGKGMAKTAFNGSFWSLIFGEDDSSPWKLPDRTEMGIPVLEDMMEDQDRSVPVLESSVKLDTKKVSMMGLKSTYQFLVKGNQDAANITVQIEDANIADVKLVDNKDSRGAKYQINAKKEGSTYVKVTYRNETTYLKVDIKDVTGSITLDTSNYIMAPGDMYTIGAFIKDENGKQLNGAQIDQLVESGKLVVRDSRTGSIVNLKKLDNGNYRVTGKNEGTTYIIYEINGTHASVKVDVKKGVKAHGSSVRNTSYFFQSDDD